MGEQKGSKLNRLVLNWPRGSVYTSVWMAKQGFNRSLINRYKKSYWLTPLSRGAYTLAGDQVSWTGGVYALQRQLDLNIHVGGKTALQIKGLAHYLPVEMKKVYLFGSAGQKLPSWFKEYNWGVEFDYTMTNLFNENIGFIDHRYGDFSIIISSPERAIMEVLYWIPQRQTFEEGHLLMENLLSLRPGIVQELLENAKSVKLKRLFLYLAEKNGHSWVDRLDLSRVDLGEGKRVIVTGGALDKKYGITIQK